MSVVGRVAAPASIHITYLWRAYDNIFGSSIFVHLCFVYAKNRSSQWAVFIDTSNLGRLAMDVWARLPAVQHQPYLGTTAEVNGCTPIIWKRLGEGWGGGRKGGK